MLGGAKASVSDSNWPTGRPQESALYRGLITAKTVTDRMHPNSYNRERMAMATQQPRTIKEHARNVLLSE